MWKSRIPPEVTTTVERERERVTAGGWRGPLNVAKYTLIENQANEIWKKRKLPVRLVKASGEILAQKSHNGVSEVISEIGTRLRMEPEWSENEARGARRKAEK